jgi:spore coat protein U-like protein
MSGAGESGTLARCTAALWRQRRIVALAAALLSASAQGASPSITCTVAATGPAFGVYDPLNAAPTVANGSVSATCSKPSGGTENVVVTSTYSAGNSGIFATRYMLSGASQLNYNLYFDSAFTQIRGDGTGGSQTGSATLRVQPPSRTATATSIIYGRIPAGQSPAPGSYIDSIIVTITY